MHTLKVIYAVELDLLTELLLLRSLLAPMAWSNAALRPTFNNFRFSDKPLVVRVPKDPRVQLRVACRKRDKRRQSGRPGQ